MSRQRVRNLMKRVGADELPLSECRDLKEFNEALAKLSDAQVVDAWSRTVGIAATRLTDDELLRQLDEARTREEQH